MTATIVFLSLGLLALSVVWATVWSLLPVLLAKTAIDSAVSAFNARRAYMASLAKMRGS